MARAALILFFVLNICFFPCIWGRKTLLESSRDAPSILFQGSAAGNGATPLSLRVLDPGAAAWQTEAWVKLIQHQYFSDKTVPLWNPNQGYGQPLAANMQSQPFYPLTVLLALHVTPKTYNWFLLLRLFAAGLFTYLYARYFLSFFPAVSAAVSCMLGGYYILFISMPHLSVETLLPLGLFAAEYLLRKNNFRAISLFSLMILLAFVGGMPESAFLLFTFVYSYWLFRLIADPLLRRAWLQSIRILVTSTLLGVSLSMFLLLPFFEYARNSSVSHGGSFKTGLLFDKFDLAAGAYILPLLYGLPHSSTIAAEGSINRNYSGVLTAFLALIACAALLRTRTRGPSVLKQLTIFFACSVVLIALKHYGVEPINQIGQLPLFSLIEFRKYAEPTLSLCLAILSGIGIEWLIRKAVSLRLILFSFGVTLLLAAAAALHSWPLVRTKLLHSHPLSPSLWAFLVAALLLCGVALFPSFSHRAPSLRSAGIYWLTLIAIQACCCFVVPAYYLYDPPPNRSNNPYAGAPFIDFLQTKTTNLDRIAGQDGVLVPNWAAAFSLYDIRAHDAMYVRDYFPFLDNFFPAYKTMAPELESTFRGIGNYDFANPPEQRLLQLSSARFIAAQRAYAIPDPRVLEILAQNHGHFLPGKETKISENNFAIDGIPRSVLGEHPPYQRLPYRLAVGNNSVFHFAYAINPQTYGKGGDGVGFKLEVKDRTGKISPLFYRYLDPNHNPTERHWMSASVDLTAYRGQSIQLLFSTDPGPNGNTDYDWAAWADLHFDGDPSPAAPSPFKQIYEGEARLFAYPKVLPRAALFYNANIVTDRTAALRKLADPSLDVLSSVVLYSASLDKQELAAAAQLNAETPRPATAAAITSYKPESVSIAATLTRPGILMLNDTGYPGWTVTVDGRPSHWFSADYLFRGVFLTAGKHLVQFVYKPASFYYGASISAAAALLMVIWAFAKRFVPSR